MDFATISAWLSPLFLAMALVGCGYSLAASVQVGRFAGRKRPTLAPDAPRPSVTILKPLCGDEPKLYEHLESFCRQDYAGALQIVFGVQKATDGAIAAVERLKAAHPGMRLDLVVDATLHGSNRKVSNLINMAGLIAHDVVVLADSDMQVLPDYLESVIAELSQPGIGGVTCLYHGVPVRDGLAAQLSAMAIDVQFAPNVIVGTALGLARPCFGSTIALRRATLDAIGGFSRFKDDLADDYAIGEAIRATGATVSIPNFTIGHACVDTGLVGLWRHELRWNRTIRNVDPLGFAGSVVTHAVPLALIGALLPGASVFALPVAALTLACRVLLCLRMERSFAIPAHAYWLLPIRDILSFANFAWSFVSGAVTWKGHDYRVVADGTLIPEPVIGSETGATPV